MPFLSESVDARITRDEAELLERMIYTGKWQSFIVAAGFRTDFASVPRLVTALVPKMGVHTLAAILHDWFCVLLKLGTCPVSSADADGIFRRVMRENGASLQRAWLAWTAVRWAALGSSYRRPGWLSTFPQLLAVTLAVLLVLSLFCVLLGAAVLWAGGMIV